jgi:phosphate-selective porin OprO and OprP
MAFDSYWQERATAALALARVGKQTVSPFAFGVGPGEYAVTGRLTGLPVYADEGRRLLHVGIVYSLSGTDNHNFATANRPLVRAGAGSQEVPNIIQTGNFFTSDPVQLLDLELAAVLGRFSMSAEYQYVRGTDVFGQFSGGVFSDPRGDVTYQSVYAECGFFLTPDYRRYNKKEGVWGRQLATPDPCGGHTSSPWLFDHTPLQLICRYTYLDLASGSPVLTPSSGAQAGWENDLTTGLDWYINPQVHFIVNYVYTHLAYVNNTSGVIHGLGVRMHLDF